MPNGKSNAIYAEKMSQVQYFSWDSPILEAEQLRHWTVSFLGQENKNMYFSVYQPETYCTHKKQHHSH